MKVWTAAGFAGHWPVGTAAVVVADSAPAAAGLLSDALERCGLPQRIDPAAMVEINTETPQAIVLCDGDY